MARNTRGDNMTPVRIKAMLDNDNLETSGPITGELIGDTYPTQWKLFFPGVGIEIESRTLWGLGRECDRTGISDVQFDS